MRKWVDALIAMPGALEDFGNHFADFKRDAQARQDAASTWEDAKEALGSKKGLDSLAAFLKVELKENEAYARFQAQR